MVALCFAIVAFSINVALCLAIVAFSINLFSMSGVGSVYNYDDDNDNADMMMMYVVCTYVCICILYACCETMYNVPFRTSQNAERQVACK